MDTAVELEQVTKRYGYLRALDSVSTKIEKGESVALLGHNGAGKTTLLKILATHITPSSGTVNILGKNAFQARNETRKHVGYVAHESFLYDELTVEENLRFYAGFFSADEKLVHEMIDFLKMDRWYTVQVKNLSHGLRKRADIVRALMHNPELVLLDEFFSGLDTETCNLLVDYFRQQDGKTILTSSHSNYWAKKLCRRAIFLKKGRIERDKQLA